MTSGDAEQTVDGEPGAEQTVDGEPDAENDGDDELDDEFGYHHAENDGDNEVNYHHAENHQDDNDYHQAEQNGEDSDVTIELVSGQQRRMSSLQLNDTHHDINSQFRGVPAYQIKVDPALLALPSYGYRTTAPPPPPQLFGANQPQSPAHFPAASQFPAPVQPSAFPQPPISQAFMSVQPPAPPQPQPAVSQALMSIQYSPPAASSSLQVAGSAADLKRQYSQILGKGANGRRLTGDRDPENAEIMRLRQEHDMDFDAIARVLNEERLKKGLVSDLTANAVFSRYKRNAPLIAAANGTTFAATAKDNRYAKIKFARVKPITGFDEREDALLVQAHKDVRDGFWTYVSARIVQLGGDSHAPELCARRFQYV